MKKTLILLLIGMIVFSMASMDSLAAKKSKKSAGSITQEDMTSMSETIDRLTRKVYANSLFSPADNASMIEIKIKLDNQMLIAPDITLAPLYYKAANLYKAKQALTAMGIAVVEPNEKEGETTGQAANAPEEQTTTTEQPAQPVEDTQASAQ